MVKLLIFDFDGVLVDSTHLWKRIYKKILRSLGIKKSKREINIDIMKSHEEVLKTHANGRNHSKVRKLYRRFLKTIHSDDFINKFRTRKNVKSVLKNLRNKEYIMVVASGCNKEIIDKSLRKLKIRGFFNLIVSRNDVKKQKPNPEMILKAIKAFNMGKEDAIYIGDSCSDIETAKNAGIKSVLFVSDITDGKWIKGLNPDFIINDMKDVETVLEGV